MGKTTLADVAALISRARFCVTNDSGPMHIAAAMGVPVFGIFGPTPPERYGPFPLSSPKNRVIRAPGGDLSKLSARAAAGTGGVGRAAFPRVEISVRLRVEIGVFYWK